jgi:hypothetical protein
MSFDLARTPTLEAVATKDQQTLAQDLQKRAEESIAAAEARPEVVAARAAQQRAEERLNRLRKAERGLSSYAKDSREQMAAMEIVAIEAMVESAATKNKIDFKKLEGLATIESQNRVASRAIEHLIEKLIPLAQISNLREEAHALVAEARAVEGVAQVRAEKVLSALRSAVTDEMVLPVDLSKGVAGALVAHAGRLKKRAVEISENADHIERTYQERMRGRR